MQTKFTKSLLATAILFGLTACGSSRGDSSNEPTANSMQSNEPLIPNNRGNSQSSNPSYQSAGMKGGMYIISADSQGLPQVTVRTLYSNDLNNIGLDSIALRSAKEIEAKINERTKLDGVQDINTIGYAGMIAGADKFYTFYTGHPTQNMPVNGKIKYSGHSFILDLFEDYSSDYYTAKNFNNMVGNSEFTVDLATKKLTGTLTQSHFPTVVNVNADISGNSFTGRATADYTNAAVEGKFYGDRAIGLAGILKTDTNVLRDEDSEENGIVGSFYGYDESRMISRGCVSTGRTSGGCYSYGR